MATVGCGVSTVLLYSNNQFMRSLHRFHLYYTFRRVLWRLRVALPASNNLNPWEININLLVFEEIKNEFGVPAGTGLEISSWRFDIRRIVEDGKNDEFHLTNTAIGHIPKLMYGLSKVGFKAIFESITAYATCILTAQLASRETIVSSTACVLDAEAEFLNTLESYNVPQGVQC